MSVIQERLLALQAQNEFIKCYALIDGLQYERYFGDEIEKDYHTSPLFHRPGDAKIAFAGPWLKEITESNQDSFNTLTELEKDNPAVSWLFSEWHFNNLFFHLGSYLDIKLSDNEVALFRYYDPRILMQLPEVLLDRHWLPLIAPLHEWIVYLDKKYYTANKQRPMWTMIKES